MTASPAKAGDAKLRGYRIRSGCHASQAAERVCAQWYAHATTESLSLKGEGKALREPSILASRPQIVLLELRRQ